jgi:hypothetical protein
VTSKATFQVQGSEEEPYDVVFLKTGMNLQAYCNCRAGANGLYCKHRFAILAGDASKVVSRNVFEVSVVASWLAGSDVESAMREVVVMEKQLETAKRKLSAAKKAVALAMRT